MKTLKEFSDLVLRVAGKIDTISTSVVDHVAFTKLQTELNDLQIEAPNSAVVIEARMIWFKHGLASFERDFVQPVSENVHGWRQWQQSYQGHEDSPPNLIMHWLTLVYFLNRSYLGHEGFKEVYPQIEGMLDVLDEATQVTEHHMLWFKRRVDLREKLLDGRL